MFIKLLIYFVVGVLIYRFVKGWVGDSSSGRKVQGQAPEQVDDVMIKDPVCGAYFPKRKGVSLDDGGHLVHFCSQACRDQYRERASKSK